MLDASGSTDPDGDALDYSWDLYCDDPGGTPDAVGPTPSILIRDDIPAGAPVCLTVSDQEFQSTTMTMLTVFDAPPVAVITPPPVLLAEGDVAVFSSAGSSADGGGTIEDTIVACEWDWAFSGTFQAGPDTDCSPTHTFLDDGRYAVALRVTDEDGGSAVTVSLIDVANFPPSITSTPGTTIIAVGETWTYQMEATDPGVLDQLSFELLSGPDGMIISSTGLVTWTPTTAQGLAGHAAALLAVTDGDSGWDTQLVTLDITMDGDADGMPDAWEATFGLDPELDDSADDLDGDGVSNLQEFLRGTAPDIFDGPGAPRLAAPSPGAEVGFPVSLLLSLVPATHPLGLALTYRIAVYTQDPETHPGAAPVMAGELLETDPLTSLVSLAIIPATGLLDNTRYYWRGWAHDGLVFGPPSDTGTFLVNGAQDCPSAPPPLSPEEDSVVVTRQPQLIVGNAADLDQDPLLYQFVVFGDAALLDPVRSSGQVPEGQQGTTTWSPEVALEDFTLYHWRARVIDAEGCASAWSEVRSFFVSTHDVSPSTPVIISPANGSIVTDAAPEIIVTGGFDPNRDAVSYRFEVDTDASFDSPAYQASPDVPALPASELTRWRVPAQLPEDALVYVRVRSVASGVTSEPVFSLFRVNVQNDPPTAPVVRSPAKMTVIPTGSPSLTVDNATDPDGDVLTYSFEIYADEALSDLVEVSGPVPEGSGQTSWKVASLLLSGQYWWRARAADPGASGPWCEPSSFVVLHPDGTAPPREKGGGCSAASGHAAEGDLAVTMLLLVFLFGSMPRRIRSAGCRLLMAIALLLVSTGTTYGQPRRVTWTSTGDFEIGAMRFTNVTAVAVPDQLQIDLGQIQTPYLWIPNTGSNTVAQMRVTDGTVLRVENPCPAVPGNDPSRTAVDLDGNCWVGLRFGNALARLGAQDLSLDRCFTNPDYFAQGVTEAFDLVRSVSINSEGNIWVGSWDDAHIRLFEPYTGAILNSYQWGAVFDGAVHPEAESYRPVVGGGAPFGSAVDEYGNLWLAQTQNHIGQYDAYTGEHRMTFVFPFSTFVYGIAVDVAGNVWFGNGSAGGLGYLPRSEVERCSSLGVSPCMASGAERIVAPVGVAGGGQCPSNSYTHGVAADPSGNVWVACFGFDWDCPELPSNGGVMWVDGMTRQVLGVFRVGGGPNAISVTSDGSVWAVNRCGQGPNFLSRACPNGYSGSNEGTVSRLRSSDGSVVATYRTCGGSPFPYSDLSGHALKSQTFRRGLWRQVHDSNVQGIEWSRIDWRAALPPGAMVELRLWAGDDLAAAPAMLPLVVPMTAETGTEDILAHGLSGRYVVIEAFLYTRWDTVGPAIEEITLTSVCIANPAGETCNGLDDDCNGLVDDLEPILSPACDSGLHGVCAEGVQVCLDAAWRCVPYLVPEPEVCDGLDNDCDGEADEGVTNACGFCGPPPVEVCDGIDNDCDGLVDEGVMRTCMDYTTCTLVQTCDDCAPPPAEVCDGLDNNCDGRIDEGVTILCIDYQPGSECGVIEVCGSSCPEPPVEICDGLDNDCDGDIDEDAHRICIDYSDCSTYVTCEACEPAPEEVCNGLDDDCDGEIDEGVTNVCGYCGDPPEEVCNGLDDDCDGEIDEGVTNACGYCGDPPEEVCNGLDDDCDGEIDEDTGAECEDLLPGGYCVSTAGECTVSCVGGECPEGRRCVDGDCLTDPCWGISCDVGLFCLEGHCVDACLSGAVTCEEDEICIAGVCVPEDCSSAGCPDGFECVDHACRPDPCAGVECTDGSVCVHGNCVESECLDVECPEGQVCLDGVCQNTAVGNPCGAGLPQCGEGLTCYEGYCRDIRDPLLPTDDSGSGAGCGCAAGSRLPSGSALPALLVAGFLLLRRRRRSGANE